MNIDMTKIDSIQNKIARVSMSGAQLLNAINTDIDSWCENGSSPLVVMRESETGLVTEFLPEKQKQSYGHIPKGIAPTGKWPDAAAFAVACYMTGALCEFNENANSKVFDTILETYSDTKLAGNKSILTRDNIDAGWILAFLLGRKPTHDGVLLWQTSGLTHVRFDIKNKLVDTARSIEAAQNKLAIDIRTFCGYENAESNTIAFRRGNVGQMISFTRLTESELVSAVSDLTDILVDGSASTNERANAARELLEVKKARESNTAIFRNPITGVIGTDSGFEFAESDHVGIRLTAEYENAVRSNDTAAVSRITIELRNHMSVLKTNADRSKKRASIRSALSS